jgi:hypothetical protein
MQNLRVSTCICALLLQRVQLSHQHRVRHVRCDEAKPACQRCVSTGRTCEGYALPSHLALLGRSMHYPPSATDFCAATSDIPLMQSGRRLEELRSFSYFLEVTAPSLAGAFHSDFWLLEMPRVCHVDQALWHAIVSLGAVHETYMANTLMRDSPLNAFATSHYNTSVIALVESSPSAKSRWKTLTLSTILACICMIGGQRSQARMHWTAGRQLLREFDKEEAARLLEIGKTGQPLLTPLALPVSVSSVRSMLIALEMVESEIDKAKISQPPTLLSKEDT